MKTFPFLFVFLIALFAASTSAYPVRSARPLSIDASAKVVSEKERYHLHSSKNVAAREESLYTVARILGQTGKAFRWECWTCWVERECCPNYCPQNC